MSLIRQKPKILSLYDKSYPVASGVDFTNQQGMAVEFAANISSDEAQVTTATTGANFAGILKYPDASATTTPTHRAQVCRIGVTNGRSGAAFNAGVPLMIGDVYGRLIAWTSGNYIVAWSEEAATAADQMVAVEVFGHPTYK